MEDEKIIALYWDRDQTAIAETQQKYGRYCGSIAHNIVHDALHDCAGGEEPLTQMARKELAASINRFLEGLDRESRIIFMRRYWYMDGIGAIAGRLAVSESKVKSSLYRSRGKLRRHLEREGLLS